MFLQDKQTGNTIQILDITALHNPATSEVPGRDQNGEEEQEPETYSKQQLIFPSGEDLPRCWLDANYRNSQN